ncbi:hypothetical protein OHA40_09820 [Nocardia sp. NBC_00508]|uniref:hypothetical protein n=1 Tax=Nocardia sp. NBC_00508 TaxID=2975992 RepID=UPI002E8015D7|nr:hypothetical protein [Nocardia sp. NBC_00508]WUD68368.1 hypothetical protein OHA40_09820 [Nocardia sp. NBC_00508]
MQLTAQTVGYKSLIENLQRLVDEIRPRGRAGDALLAHLTRAHPEMGWHRAAGGLLALSPWDIAAPTSRKRAPGKRGCPRSSPADRVRAGECDGRRIRVVNRR